MTSKVCESSSLRRKRPDRCLFGYLHLATAMKLIVAVGVTVLLALMVLLYFKFRKSMFVLAVPASFIVFTVAGTLFRRPRLIWPIVAVSCFHVVLASYVLLIFSFYFFIKPYYIIMVLNWAFNTLHTEKTPSFYLQCGCIYLFLFVFLTFNVWQGIVSYNFKRLLSRNNSQQPTILVVNKPTVF